MGDVEAMRELAQYAISPAVVGTFQQKNNLYLVLLIIIFNCECDKGVTSDADDRIDPDAARSLGERCRELVKVCFVLFFLFCF